MLNVDFNHVTIDISDYIKGYRIYFRNGSIAKFDTDLNIEAKKALTHISFSGFAGFFNVFLKCYALNIPKIDNLEIFRILLSNNIFPNGIRPAFLGLKPLYTSPGSFCYQQVPKDGYGLLVRLMKVTTYVFSSPV